MLSLSTFLFTYGIFRKDNIQEAYLIISIARSGQGIASASTMSAGMTLCAISHSESNRGTVMGMAMSGVALGRWSTVGR